ncbi:hypothetical protein [Quadrisphaera granulorum]|uniref:hypothetical protein n=1 Tax=Quadrisphaera granulorum TaxID=317664 RepID=UPI001472FE17|nr:hypothetical protein [Quadrisphaera granulorum]
MAHDHVSVRPVTDPSHPEPVDDPAGEARAAVTLGLYTSAARCLVQYVLAPALGTLGVLLGPLGLVLQVLGAVVAVSGARRLHRLRHAAWPAYVVVAALVVGVTVWSLLDAVGALR